MKKTVMVILLSGLSSLAWSDGNGKIHCGDYRGPSAKHLCHVDSSIEGPGVRRERQAIRIVFSTHEGKIIADSVCGDKDKGAILRRECRKEAKRLFKQVCKARRSDKMYCYAADHLRIME